MLAPAGRANQWTKEQLAKWGLQNAAVGPWGEIWTRLGIETVLGNILHRTGNAALPLLRESLVALDKQTALEEAEFRRSGMNFSICGGEIEHNEIPGGFPSFLAVTESLHRHAE